MSNIIENYNNSMRKLYKDIKIGDKVKVLYMTKAYGYHRDWFTPGDIYEVYANDKCRGCSEKLNCPHPNHSIYLKGPNSICGVALGDLNGIEYKEE